jgi:hypothetical protein
VKAIQEVKELEQLNKQREIEMSKKMFQKIPSKLP